MILQTTDPETLLRELSPGDPDTATTRLDLESTATQLIDFLFIAGLFVAVAALIILAIRIMFARATGDIAGAKASSNGIFWVLGGVILILLAPTLVLVVWEAFGGTT